MVIKRGSEAFSVLTPAAPRPEFDDLSLLLTTFQAFAYLFKNAPGAACKHKLEILQSSQLDELRSTLSLLISANQLVFGGLSLPESVFVFV